MGDGYNFCLSKASITIHGFSTWMDHCLIGILENESAFVADEIWYTLQHVETQNFH
jgi:hypothetical protein